MSDKQLLIILQILEIRYEKPGKYFYDFSHCVGFIWGIRQMSHSFNIITFDSHKKIYQQVAKEFGWEYVANSPGMLIQEMEWEENQKIREYLKIEIETWRRIIAFSDDNLDVNNTK